jgi:hypothetical protein
MGRTERRSNAIEEQVDGVAPVLSPGLHLAHDFGGIRDRKLFFLFTLKPILIPFKGRGHKKKEPFESLYAATSFHLSGALKNWNRSERDPAPGLY